WARLETPLCASAPDVARLPQEPLQRRDVPQRVARLAVAGSSAAEVAGPRGRSQRRVDRGTAPKQVLVRRPDGQDRADPLVAPVALAPVLQVQAPQARGLPPDASGMAARHVVEAP